MGYFFAFAAFLFIGSYLAPIRWSTVKGGAFLPFMGFGMVVLALFMGGSLSKLWANPIWFWGSILSGILWALGQGLANQALEEVSLAKAVVFFNINSFINMGMGLLVFKETVSGKGLAFLVAGGILLFIGAAGVARATAAKSKEGNLKKGVALSLAAGVFWGLYFAPLKALQTWHPQEGLTLLTGFSGLLLGGGLCILATAVFFPKGNWTPQNVGWGAVSAILWTLGTVGFLLAIQSLGLSRAVPIINSNTLVYAAWSLFVFKEFPISQAPKVLGGALVVAVGVALMALSK